MEGGRERARTRVGEHEVPTSRTGFVRIMI